MQKEIKKKLNANGEERKRKTRQKSRTYCLDVDLAHQGQRQLMLPIKELPYSYKLLAG